MKRSDKLRQAREAVVEKLRTMETDAADRIFTDDERKAFDGLIADIKGIDEQIESAITAEEAIRGEHPSPAIVPSRDFGEGAIRAYTNKERMFTPRAPDPNLSFGRLVRAMARKSWRDAPAEYEVYQRALATTPDSAGGVMVPTELMSGVIDLARDASVMVQAGTLTFPMSTKTLTVAKLLTPATAEWKAENAPANESEQTFGPIDFTARTLIALVRSSVELAEDAPDFDQTIQGDIIAACGLALDGAGLAGSGVGEVPLGALVTPGISDVALGGPIVNYDPFIMAMGKVREMNETPQAVVMHSKSLTELDMLKDTTDQYLVPPPAYAKLNQLMTNAMPEAFGLVADFSKGAFGIRNSGMLEVTREANSAFQNLQILIRLYLRADYHVLRAGAFAKVSGITHAP